MASEKSMWKPLVLKKGKARSCDRIFIARKGERSGFYRSLEAAQAECDRRNLRDEADEFEAQNGAWAAQFVA